ncbi:hypothetical protein PoB_001356300 [Plakobranchus ocellatus]|uniref:Uncharacterized protein n=1 Tax=Plakobranchus ocellatus TaxID=259542 RepID=A0AAV3YXE8_9GAST|nr:hypothetical protein PoB_001356300 [Plakobranchus ocellatus]
MEFTTRFALHFQTTRPLRRVRPHGGTLLGLIQTIVEASVRRTSVPTDVTFGVPYTTATVSMMPGDSALDLSGISCSVPPPKLYMLKFSG